jgi:TPR repeat protein
VRWYRKAAEQGLAGAQFNLSVSYDKGVGVTQDYAEALKWYRKSAEQGFADAQVNLGVMHARGNAKAAKKINGKLAGV